MPQQPIERLGGVVEITDAEVAVFGGRHGRLQNASVQIERIPDGLRFTAIQRVREPLA